MFWYLKTTAANKEFVKVNAEQRVKEPAFDHICLAASLSKLMGQSIAPYELPFKEITLQPTEVTVKIKDSLYACPFDTYQCRLKAVDAPASSGRYWVGQNNDREGQPVPSPDGSYVAFIKNHNVYIRPSRRPADETALSFDGSEGTYYSAYITWSSTMTLVSLIFMEGHCIV